MKQVTYPGVQLPIGIGMISILFFFILGGKSIQEIDFQYYEITKYQVMIIPKGAIHWEREMIDLFGYIILFRDEFFSNPQKQLLYGLLRYAIALRKLLIPVSQTEVQTIKLYFELLIQEQKANTNQNQTFILQNLMLALLNKLEGLIQNMPGSQSFISYRKPFQHFIELLDDSIHQQNSLDDYAVKLNMTKRKLNETIKRITGQTATNFIINRIVLEAKRELCFTEKTIKEIAFELGYESQYYFSRVFKNRTGKSPDQFRSEYAE